MKFILMPIECYLNIKLFWPANNSQTGVMVNLTHIFLFYLLSYCLRLNDKNSLFARHKMQMALWLVHAEADKLLSIFYTIKENKKLRQQQQQRQHQQKLERKILEHVCSNKQKMANKD